MRYRNVHIREAVRSGDESRALLWLLGGVTIAVAVVAATVMLLSDWLAVRVPFSAEQTLYESVTGSSRAKAGKPADGGAAEQALIELGQRVAQAMALPADLSIKVHYVDAPTVNAMATLGGHVFVFRGLLEKLKSEDALAAILAHEAGHVRHRHVIRAIGRGVTLVTILGMLGIKSQGLNNWALGKGSQMTALSYSREAEREADLVALETVQALYGHGGGIDEMMATLAAIDRGGAEVLRSHPLSAHRRQELADEARRRGYSLQGETRPLPPALSATALREVRRSGPAAGRSTSTD